MVRNQLENFVKDELVKRQYTPVYTPNIGRVELYQVHNLVGELGNVVRRVALQGPDEMPDDPVHPIPLAAKLLDVVLPHLADSQVVQEPPPVIIAPEPMPDASAAPTPASAAAAARSFVSVMNQMELPGFSPFASPDASTMMF